MPVEFESAEDLSNLDGGALRSKLEAALAENRKLQAEVASGRTKEILSTKGYNLVKPEDLAGVEVDKLEAKAKELQEQKLAERREVLKSVFAQQGLEGEELESQVDTFLAGEAPAPSQDGGGESWSAGDVVGGTPPRRARNLPDMTDATGNFMAHFDK